VQRLDDDWRDLENTTCHVGEVHATLVTELLVRLRERGLDVTRPILTVIDGSKALRRALYPTMTRKCPVTRGACL
jgi:hypothetical protein